MAIKSFEGFILIRKKITEWGWYTDVPCKTLFLHCIIKANYEDKEFMGSMVKRGEFITSVSHLAVETGLSVQQVRTAIKKLKKTGELTIKSHNKYTAISIVKYNDYQELQQTDNNQATNNQQSSNKQSTTTNEVNEVNKVNEENISMSPQSVVDDLNSAKKNVPYAKIKNLWNEIFQDTAISKCDKVTEKRKAAIRQRWYNGTGQDLNNWENAFSKIKQSDFLMGNNDKDWQASFDWVIRPDSITKIMEGKYDNREKSKAGISW